MALPRTWLPRSEEILDVLRRMKSKKLDRPCIEELFQLQRRAAINLMHQAGATGTRGVESLVDRRNLIAWVERISEAESSLLARKRSTSEDLSRSVQEVQAVRAALREHNRPPVSFRMVDDVLQSSFASLPSSVTIEPGRISVDFPAENPEAALPLLYALAMALANDFETFRELSSTERSAYGSPEDLLSSLQAAKQEGILDG
jgi:hypothetical protein